MNKAYRTVWNEAAGSWVVVSELARAKGRSVSGGQGVAIDVDLAPRLARLALNIALATGLGVTGSAAWAGAIINCGGGLPAQGSFTEGNGGGVWTTQAAPSGETACNGGTGVALSESNTGNGGLAGQMAYIQVGSVGGNAAGAVTLYGPTGITLNGTTSLAGNKITDLAPGVNATDAVNVSQLQSLSTSVVSGADLSSLSTGLSTAQSGVGSLSTGLSTTNSSLASLSSSVGNGIGSLSTGLSTAQAGIGSLSTGLSNSVMYDTAAHTKVTLGGAGASAPVTLTNVKAGAAPTDAVNVSQLTSLSTSSSTGLSTAQSGIGSLSTGLSSIGSNLASLSTVTSTSIGSLSTGLSTAQSGVSSLSTGLSTTNSNVAAISSSLSGSRHYVDINDGGTQQGNFNNDGATGANAIAIGPGAKATGVGAVALGRNATASTDNSVALGANSVTAAAVNVPDATVGGIKYSNIAGASPVGVVSVGAPGQERQITNVAAGRITQDSTDAVNGSELFSLASEVSSLSTGLSTTASSLASLSTSAGGGGNPTNPGGGGGDPTNPNNPGGGNANDPHPPGNNTGDPTNTATGNNSSASGGGSSAYGSGSTASGPGSSSYGSNSTASGNNSTAIGSNSTASGNNSTAVGSGSVASGANSKADGYHATASGDSSTALGAFSTASGPSSVALGAGSVADQPNTVSVGSPGAERRITNVAPGINGTDAVNVNQLRSTQAAISDVARRAYSGVAAVTALTMIPDVDAGKTIAVGAGGGSYQGYGASSLGVSVRLTDNIKMKGGVGISAAGNAYGGGVSYQW
jgi:hypothetical protein